MNTAIERENAMNAVAKIPVDAVSIALPTGTTIDVWWSQCEDLFQQRRQLDWMIADWVAAGAERYGAQACFDFAAEKLSLDPKELRSSVKVAGAFPPSHRAADVPFEVHAYIAQLPQERRLETLQRASAEHWGVKQVREVVVTHRQEAAMFEDEDRETRLAVEIIRAWNRAPVESRRYFWELAAKADFDAIVEDEAVDD